MIETKILTADEIYAKLMEKVAPLPCQESYARELCSLVSYHLRKNELVDLGSDPDELPSQSALIIAPTGTGKTYLIRTIAKLVDINFLFIDASSLCRDGWKGLNLSQILCGSFEATNDYERWKKSIIFIDEFDKTKLWGDHYDQANPMDNLLQLFNNGEITVEDSSRSSKTLDISRFTILLGGAFEGLEEIIAQRLNRKSKIGFVDAETSEDCSDGQFFKQITADDLKVYGVKPELIGRIGSILTLDQMTIEDYRCLLTGETGGVSKRYKTFLSKAYGVNFRIDDSAVEFISNHCTKSKLGARAVNPIVNDLMRKAFVEIERDSSIAEVVLSADTNGCFTHYIKGSKQSKSILEPKSRPEIYFSPDCPDDLINEMIDIYSKSTRKKDFLKEFSAFLYLSVHYLYRCCPRPDRCFSSLLKLAKTLEKNERDEESTFELLIVELVDKTSDPKDTSTVNKHIQTLKDSWSKSTVSSLTQALNYVYFELGDKITRT